MKPIYLSSHGFRPDKDNSKILNRQIETARDGTTIIFPKGEFLIMSSIIHKNKTLYWEGQRAGENTTTLKIGSNVTALEFNGYRKSYFSRIRFINNFNDATESQDGLRIYGPVKMEDCEVRNFFGNGIVVFADIKTKSGGNASFCRFNDVAISGCHKSGMYFHGGDANQCNVDGVDVRDNWGYGILDASYLGNQFRGCMAHNNRRGNYMASGVNNRSGFVLCYSEGDSPISYFHGHARVFGGLWSGGAIVEHKAEAYISEPLNPYEQIGSDVVGEYLCKLFKRVIVIDSKNSKDGYQWRLYNLAGDIFQDKSDHDFESADDAIENVKNKVISYSIVNLK
jgi:hypothetical protein